MSVSPSSLRVLHVCDQYFLLTQNWIQTQIGFLERYEPFVLTGRTENLDKSTSPVAPHFSLRDDRTNLDLWLDRLSYRLRGVLHTYDREARRFDPHVIHAHFGHKGYGTLPISQRQSAPLVTTFYGYDLSALLQKEPEWHARYECLFNQGAHFLTEGPHMRQQLIHLGCPPEKTTVQHLGIPLDQYEYAPNRLKWDRNGKEPLSVLMVGRFTEKKGMVYGLKAFSKFLQWGGDGILTIVGDADEGVEQQVAYKSRMMEIIDEHNLTDVVDLRGFMPMVDLRELYSKHHVLLAPSVTASNGDNEGGAPVVVIEASATGMPVIGSRHCDIPEVVKDGITGLLAPERDADSLADALSKLASTPGLLQELGLAARERMVREYNAHVQAQRLESVYDHVRGA